VRGVCGHADRNPIAVDGDRGAELEVRELRHVAEIVRRGRQRLRGNDGHLSERGPHRNSEHDCQQ